MERETKDMIMLIFSITALSVAIVPVGWEIAQRATDQGTVSNAKMANQLWGVNPAIPATVQANLQPNNFYKTPIMPGAISANISNVQFDYSVWPPRVTVQGSEFGNTPAPSQDVIQLTDKTRSWEAGVLFNVKPQISLWANNQVDISGFSNYGTSDLQNFGDGLGSLVFAPGDTLQIQITNPQTNTKNTTTVTYPQNALMPIVSIDQMPTIIAGISHTVSGTVTFNGQPLANQAVNLSSSSGTFSGGNGAQVTPQDYTISTDSQGRWSATYTPPQTAGTVSISAMADAETAAQNVTVAPPFKVTLTAEGNSTNNNVVLTAKVNYPLNGFTLSIIDQTTGKTIASTTQGTTLTANVTEANSQTDTYVAQVN